MAKKINPNLVQHGSSKRCKVVGCKGKPKKVYDATQFEGTICAAPGCACVYMYDKTQFKEQNDRVEIRLKDKTMEVDEKELEKLINEANKKSQKKVKKKDSEQLNLL